MRASHLSFLAAGILVVGAVSSPVCAEPQTALVFFSEWSALIDDDAAKAIQHAANLAKASTDHKVTVTGYADTTGSEVANKLLSQLRAQVVADKLIEDGVAAGAIAQKAEGETPAPEDSKQSSRRVGITVE